MFPTMKVMLGAISAMVREGHRVFFLIRIAVYMHIYLSFYPLPNCNVIKKQEYFCNCPTMKVMLGALSPRVIRHHVFTLLTSCKFMGISPFTNRICFFFLSKFGGF